MHRMLLVAVALVAFGSWSYAAEGPNVPSNVEKALTAKFGITETSNWVVYKEDGKKIYATRWKDKDGVMHEADFDSSGNVVKTAHSVKPGELPKAVADAVEKKVPGATMTEAKLEEGKKTEYEVRVTDTAAKKKLVVVSANGDDATVYDF